jgi:hypothetical protein
MMLCSVSTETARCIFYLRQADEKTILRTERKRKNDANMTKMKKTALCNINFRCNGAIIPKTSRNMIYYNCGPYVFY